MKLGQLLKRQVNLWSVSSFLLILTIALPSFFVIIELFSQPNENWEHIQQYVLKDYLLNTIIILLFTGILTALIGTTLAWFISAYQFPLRNFFRWALILPLAIPAYIGAYTYHGMVNYTGIIQSTLRNTFGIQVNQQYFDIMNIPGAIFIFTLFLYPYVYTITRSFLTKQSASMIENARLLGRSAWTILIRIILPISRSAIVGGVSLVGLEVLNDYGVVKYFGIQTLTTAVFQTWFAMGDLNTAIKLSGTLMTAVLFILVLERIIRGRKKFSYTTTKVRPLQPIQLRGWKAWMVFMYCLTIFGLAFFIPLIQLIDWMLLTYQEVISSEFIQLIWNSLFVALIATLIILISSLIIANFTRLNHGFFSQLFSKIVVLGYSIPGAVIAIAVITLFISLDKQLFAIYQAMGLNPSLLLSTSLVVLIFAYVIRFLAIGYNSIESGFMKMGNSYTEASRILGMSLTKSFFKVDLPLIRSAIFSGGILAFVDILKELPLTLLLQPFNFYTLSTKAFQFAKDEMIHEAALASILIIIISSTSIFLFHKLFEKETS